MKSSRYHLVTATRRLYLYSGKISGMNEEAIYAAYQHHNPWWENYSLEDIGEKRVHPRLRQTLLGQIRSLERFSRSDFEFHYTAAIENRFTLVAAPNGIGKTATLTRIAKELVQRRDLPDENLFYLPLGQPVFRIGDRPSIETAVDWYFRNVYGSLQVTLDQFPDESDTINKADQIYLLADDVHMISGWVKQAQNSLVENPELNIVATAPTAERIDLSPLKEANLSCRQEILLHQKFYDQLKSTTDEELSESLKNRCRDFRWALADFAQETTHDELDSILSDFDELLPLNSREVGRRLNKYARSGNSRVRSSRDVTRDLELTIYRDIPRYQDVESRGDLHSLCSLAALEGGKSHSLKDWSNALNVDSRTFSRYLELLKDFYILTPSDHYTHKRRRAVRLYLRDPAHIMNLGEIQSSGPIVPHSFQQQLFSSLVFDHCKRLAFFYSGYEEDTPVYYWEEDDDVVDFVVETGFKHDNRPLPVNLSIDRSIQESVEGIRAFTDKNEIQAKGGIVLTSPTMSRSDLSLAEDRSLDKVTIIPLWKFLMAV